MLASPFLAVVVTAWFVATGLFLGVFGAPRRTDTVSVSPVTTWARRVPLLVVCAMTALIPWWHPVGTAGVLPPVLFTLTVGACLLSQPWAAPGRHALLAVGGGWAWTMAFLARGGSTTLAGPAPDPAPDSAVAGNWDGSVITTIVSVVVAAALAVYVVLCLVALFRPSAPAPAVSVRMRDATAGATADTARADAAPADATPTDAAPADVTPTVTSVAEAATAVGLCVLLLLLLLL